MGNPWGGSEELWSQTALNLVRQGVSVSASVTGYSTLHPRVQYLIQAGVEIWPRAWVYSLRKRLWRKVAFRRDSYLVAEVQRLLDRKRPSLVLFSSGDAISQVELLELCVARNLPFVTIGQANRETWWPADEEAERYRNVLAAAMRCYFVSRANWLLFEKQIGCKLSNAEVVRNPFNVKFDASVPWPKTVDGELLFACVGRLDPIAKGQDIILEALATRAWMDRKWRLTLYGQGPMRNSLERLVQQLGLKSRVIFAGHVAVVEDIWATNHVLVMPSRFEGLPLAMVEAMLCGRLAIATDVAGHSELIEDGTNGFLAEAATVPSMAKALERFWVRRTDMEHMGRAAREKIRQIIPADPVGEFTEKIKAFIASPDRS